MEQFHRLIVCLLVTIEFFFIQNSLFNSVNKNQTLLDDLESCLKFNGVLTLIPLISIN